MTVTAFLLSLAMSLATPPSPLRPPAPEDAARLAGEWQMTAMAKEGEAAPSWWVSERRLTFAPDGPFVLWVGTQRQSEGKAVLGGGWPATVDLQTEKGDFAGKTLYCIYDLTDGKLRLCCDTFGTGRPADFTTGPGSGRMLMTFRRAKQ